MNYIEVDFVCNPVNEIFTDVLNASLADIGFETFVETEKGVLGYIPENLFDENVLKQVVDNFALPCEILFSFKFIEDKDWNEEWEKKSFKPLILDTDCIVLSPSHNVDTSAYKYKILIDPKMAFGTGHHQTTELMMREILKGNFKNKTVLDMGCGTAILSIMSSLCGASSVEAIDIDEWAYQNALNNLQLNGIQNVSVEIGDATLLNHGVYDIILANINRNILLADIRKYVSVLKKGGELYMSGFFVDDIEQINKECLLNNLSFVSFSQKDNWAVVKFIL